MTEEEQVSGMNAIKNITVGGMADLLVDVAKNNMIKIISNDEKLTIPFDSVYECRIIPQI